MSKSIWKIPYISKFLMRKKYLKNKNINVFIRNSIISFAFVGKKFRVYNGTSFVSIKFVFGMIGLKLGEFSISKVLNSKIVAKKFKKAKKN